MATEKYESGGINRREVLRRLGVAGAAFAVAPGVLAACGGDNDDSSSGTTGGAGTSAGAAPAGDVGQRLLDALGLKSTDKLGGEVTFRMGAVLALTGNGSYYGKTMTNGIELAVKHIKAAGGPTFEVAYKDHKSGDPAAGVTAATELGTAGFPAKLASYGDDIGAMVTQTEQYKMMTLDGGGGVGGSLQGRPFLWGARAQVAIDQYPGLFKYTKEAMPDAKTVGFVGWDLGEPLNTDTREILLKSLQENNYEFNGLLERVTPNTTDFSQVIPKIRSNEPDILLAFIFGQDNGAFMNQVQTAGLNEKGIFGFEITPDGINSSKGAFEKGWQFTYDYFDAKNAKSPLGKLFVDEFKAAYSTDPDFYAANYYEDTLAMWDMIRRVLAKGGNVNSGVDLENSLKDDPTFISVYGGDEAKNGTLRFNLTTHSVDQRVMGVFRYQNGEVTTLATFDMGGADYKKVG